MLKSKGFKLHRGASDTNGIGIGMAVKKEQQVNDESIA